MNHSLPLGLIQVVLDWWNALSWAKSVFYGIGVVAALVAIILAILAIIGVEGDDAVDAAVGAHDAAGGGGIFSVKPLTGFFLGFGWVGGLAMDAGLGVFGATLSGLGAGGAFMAVVLVMFRMILSMRSDGTARIGDAVGAVGTVYLTVPAARASGGQVTVSFQGRQETYAALSTGDAPIPSGEKVRVVEVIDNRTVRVQPI